MKENLQPAAASYLAENLQTLSGPNWCTIADKKPISSPPVNHNYVGL
jgi:hypothetical protein